MSSTGEKRRADDEENGDDDDEWIGPMPSEAAKPKKKKILEFEQVYLDNLPSSEGYEISYMHRDVITHIAVARKTNFIITASCDGHVKFWKKKEEEGIEFVKHFRSHLGSIEDMQVSCNGELMCTISDDKTAKVFDVVNFDMINMLKLDYTPRCCCWIFSIGDAIPALAISDKDSSAIHVYDGRGGGEPLKTQDKMHSQSVCLIQYNPVYDTVISVDQSGT